MHLIFLISSRLPAATGKPVEYVEHLKLIPLHLHHCNVMRQVHVTHLRHTTKLLCEAEIRFSGYVEMLMQCIMGINRKY